MWEKRGLALLASLARLRRTPDCASAIATPIIPIVEDGPLVGSRNARGSPSALENVKPAHNTSKHREGFAIISPKEREALRCAAFFATGEAS